MATAKKRAREGDLPGGRESVGQKVALAEMKIECLRGLGIRTPELDDLLKEAKNALRAKGPDAAARHADRLLVLFSVAAEELESLVARFLGKPGAGAGAARGGAAPSIREIEETVADAFRKALHSSALRRMVEVVAVEKIRSVLTDEGLPLPWIQGAVRKALEEIEAGKEPQRKRAVR